MASAETNQVLTKYVMGTRQEFDELKERFEGMDDWSAPAAAALAYMIAKDELKAEKEEEEEEEPDVYDEVVEVIKKYCHPPGNNSAHTATNEIFTLIYECLEGNMEMRDFVSSHMTVKHKIRQMFQPDIIEKPKA
jgi:hypothetical protein